MATILKIGENEYRVSGKENYIYRETVFVEVESKIYSRVETKDDVFDYDADFRLGEKRNKNWHTIDVDDFVLFGLPSIKLHDFRWNYNTAINSIFGEFSTNEFINIRLGVWDAGMIKDDEIKVYTSKDPVKCDFQAKEFLLRNGKMEVVLCAYGFNNFLCAEMPPHRFLTADFSKIGFDTYYSYKDFIPEIKEKKRLSDEALFNSSHRLLNFLTNNHHHANHKQRVVFPHL